MVGNERGQCVDQAKSPVGTCQKQNTTVGTDQAPVECSGDLLLADDTWHSEGQKCIVGGGGHGRFCPVLRLASTTNLYAIPDVYAHVRQGIAAMW